MRDWLAYEDLVVHYMPTSLKIANLFIKRLSTEWFLFSKSKLSMRPHDQLVCVIEI